MQAHSGASAFGVNRSRSLISFAVKDDLRASHFHVGGSASVKSSTVSKSFKKITLDELTKSRQPFQDLKGRVKG